MSTNGGDVTTKRKRRFSSVRIELLRKSREAALAAVQVFNNPSIQFKAETFTVLMIIAWTYLMHAYYRGLGVEYRYYERRGKVRRFRRTRHGAYVHWSLWDCLETEHCPLGKDVRNNLRFLIGLRNEIEHQMTDRLDDLLSARFQACALNFNSALKELFSDEWGIDKHLAVSLQFAELSEDQVEMLDDALDMPGHITKYIMGFDRNLTDAEYQSAEYSYRVVFVQKLVNNRNQADRVIEFVKPDSKLGERINAEMAVIKETERPKLLPTQIVEKMRTEGYTGFKMHHHTALWKAREAKNVALGYGVWVAKQWYWYERWVDEVRAHCADNAGRYE